MNTTRRAAIALSAIIAAIITITVPAHATITEDDPRWDCRTMGNLICGPTNAQGVPAGNYAGLYEPDTGEYVGGYN